MSDMMTFPDTVEEFMEQYKIVDTKQVYTNGTELVPIFRMKQWFEHLQTIETERKTGHWILGGYDDMYYVCDQCGYRRSDYYAKPKAKYCENCGAKMEEGDQDG